MAKYPDITLKRGYSTSGGNPTQIEVAGVLEALVNLWSSPASGASRAKSAIMNLARQGEDGQRLLKEIRLMINRRQWLTRETKIKTAHQELATAITRFVRPM
ncbi:MAG: hypothetical protein IT585_03710 [candidate division Zixibacteria bacterium]|nr:hypothetical protein [candidate division Zixibacteria bacterium]